MAGSGFNANSGLIMDLESLTDILFALVLFLYALSTIWYLAFVAFQKKFLAQIGGGQLWAGFGCHFILILVTYFRIGHVPAHNLQYSLSLTIWALVAVYLFFQFSLNIRILGAIVTPISTLVLVFAFCLPKPDIVISQQFQSIWVSVHVITSFIGNGAFALAASVGILYLLQEKAIKGKRRGFFYSRLPALERLDQMGYACIAIGFPMLTIGIMTGCIFAQIHWGHYWNWDPKEVWSAMTWLFYAAILHGRMALGWRGRRLAYLAIIGIFLVLFTFLGVNFLLKGHHGDFTKF
jgi:cytochrome c-type biogenesis protein CcsB